MLNKKVPHVIFKTRVRDESIDGDNPYRWEHVSSDAYFQGKKVIIFSLPGAFTPTCSTYQLPDFEKLYPEFTKNGIDALDKFREVILEENIFNLRCKPYMEDIEKNQLLFSKITNLYL